MPSTKKRVVLYLGEEHHAALKAESLRSGVPVAEIVRRLIIPPTIDNLKVSWEGDEHRRHMAAAPPERANYKPDQETR